MAESPEKMANKYAAHFNQNNNPYQIEAGELSEPMLATGSEKFSRKFSANKDMLDLVKGSTMDY